MQDLKRLFSARTIAVVGGGAWCASIMEAADRIGYSGKIVPVHPSGKNIAGLPSVQSVAQIDGPIDAAFVGVNRHATLQIVQELRDLGAGGAICFASGFAEAAAEDETGSGLQGKLLSAAGDMPILGPNCYGFVNGFDQVAVWPDQHGMAPVERGVAILTQSSNISINLTMQTRGLPIGYVITCGNQAQVSQADIAMSMLDDPRVTAIGLHIEGFSDIGRWHEVALRAARQGVPVVAIKLGASEQAQQAAVSHTASLAGSDAGADALLKRLGFGRARDLPSFLETLKLLHIHGALDSAALSSISCSGGEAGLAADTAAGRHVHFPPLLDAQKKDLGAALGPMVALANPLDYHTYIWRDAEAMTKAWRPMAADHIGLTMVIADYPRTDYRDWDCVTQAALNVRQETGRPLAVVATLPELMPPEVASQLMKGGVVPLNGLTEALNAAEIAATLRAPDPVQPFAAGEVDATHTLTEADAKAELSAHHIDMPQRCSGTVQEILQQAEALSAPLALKGLGLAHKSEAGAVALGLAHNELQRSAEAMPADHFLVEEMVTDGVAELLVGVTRDPAHGLVLTLGAGGVQTELWQDTVSLLMPVGEADIDQALEELKVNKLLQGFRGKPAASRQAILTAVLGVQDYVTKHQARLAEVEINPLICTPARAVAVDALIRMGN